MFLICSMNSYHPSFNEVRAWGSRKNVKGTGLHLCEIPNASGLTRFLSVWWSIKLKDFREVGD